MTSSNDTIDTEAYSSVAMPDTGAPIEVPPLFAWPPKPIATLKWIWSDVLFPWGLVFIGLAFLSWYFLSPSLQSMQSFEWDWIALIWVRNVALLTLFAAPLHWWLYVRRGQGVTTKLNSLWQEQNSRKFLFRSQLKDNMFWSIVSGCTIWTLFECMTYWIYANGFVDVVHWVDSKTYLLLLGFFTFFGSWAHFYFVHRLLHWPPLYRVAHALHHRNTSPQPWSGISMHPIEHLLYFSVFCIFWVVPAHPVLIVLLGLFQGISPALSHAGFSQIKVGRDLSIPSGDPFHQLHHKYYEVNYGNRATGLDKLFGSWHDGTIEAQKAFRERRRKELLFD